ncbi:23S rRNA (pseudouridine(1915)-N(3))-methyltransferase RlmH [Sulfurimonas sp. SWIR-19]|uniref:23S rRNA (pseudouridine(1915)-N(3))-methyltransferase RlmH n=1 Tax=Sulfurimonas sp. SWIR-19 TaxID=2878390 RepID=UPI001CF49004|nr:23S rRNA (pseudouridine(1915)-N(3))-methyltransferase RlmH [Sulfurimonas sp. SWIR-19]UCM99294.1 23S rRNA (pseudouridine(1915)-N(3))-methyltransferase RlmH [Sulfurimonas sp. SWIR-19]
MNIEIVSIAKREKTLYDPLYKELTKMISRFATVKDTEIFSKDVTKAHTISPEVAQKAYTKALEAYIGKDFCITLHPDGKPVDSFEFSKLLNDKMSVKFFIGGAYGFEKDFLDQSNAVISLGKITMSHKIAKVVLLEQIYRGFAILSNHPYHK